MATKPCMNCGKQVKQRYISKNKPNYNICHECWEKEEVPPQVKEAETALSNLIITTGVSIEGKKIIKYIDVICAEVIQGVGIFKDIGSGFRDVFGGSVGSYQKELDKMKEMAFKSLKHKAYKLGANAIIGIDLDYGELRGSMLMLVVNGTAVVVE